MTTAIETADVIVLGAGPAGCAAAIRARQAGLRVVMFETSTKVKVSPGETLHPGIEPLLQQLGILDQVLQAGFKRHRGIWFDSGHSRQFVPYGEDAGKPWLGFQVDRQIFHRILQQAAIDAQVTLIRDMHPEAVLIDEKRVTGVVVNGNNFYATWTVDATGRSAWLAESLRIAEQVCSPPLGVRFGWHNKESVALDGQPSFTFCRNGWDWQAPITENRIAWVKLRIGEDNLHSPMGIDLTWQFRPQCAGPGFFILGDAAARLDPSVSHGVLKAFMSGMLFASLVEAHQESGIPEETILKIYREWTYEQFKHDERHLRKQYTDSPAGLLFKQYTMAQ